MAPQLLGDTVPLPRLLATMPNARNSAEGQLAAWLVIPAYNEARVIAETLRTAQAWFRNIVVVDDCSGDATGTLALQAGAHVLRHPINLGQGAALQTGIDYALTGGAEQIVTFDADGQHHPADAWRMVETLVEERCDVVLASRFRGTAEGISRPKQLLLKLAIWYTRLTTGLALTDTHNGLRAFSRSAARAIRIRQNRMAHASEILETIGRLRLHYVEVPCTITYTEYSRAKGQRLSGSFAILADLYLRRLYK
jgi:polyprenyl-phospho-N-acetylgalactosaminyl synthase